MTQKTLTLKDVLARKIKLPVCPAVFTRLASMIANPDGSSDEISKIVSADQTLTTEVLKVANSAFYGLPRRVRSVDEAIVRLGFGEISSVVTALKAKEMFNSNAQWVAFNNVLYTHALSTAILTRSLGKKLNPSFSDVFFTAGMLHDIGKMVLQQVDPNYAVICQNGAIHGGELISLEYKTFGTTHAAIGSEILQHWNLPETLVKLTEAHHDPIPATDRMKAVRETMVLANEVSYLVAPKSSKELCNFNIALPDPLLSRAHLDKSAWMLVAVDCQRQYSAMQP